MTPLPYTPKWDRCYCNPSLVNSYGHNRQCPEYVPTADPLRCPTCGGTEVVPASGPGTKAKLVVPCPQCTAKEGEP